VQGETRAQSVISTAASHDRGVSVGDRRQYNHARRTKPSPQLISAMLASSSLTLIIHTRMEAVRMVPMPMSAGVDRSRSRSTRGRSDAGHGV